MSLTYGVSPCQIKTKSTHLSCEEKDVDGGVIIKSCNQGMTLEFIKSLLKTLHSSLSTVSLVQQ